MPSTSRHRALYLSSRPRGSLGASGGTSALAVPLSRIEYRQCAMVETAPAFAHVTCGFQSANMPLGLSFHTHACSAQS